MVLLSAQGMDAAAIARVAFTSEDRVRDVIRNFNADAGDVLVSEIAGCKHTNPADCLRPQVASPGCFSYLSSATRTPVDGTLTPPR